MSSIVLELQNEVLDPLVSTSNLLRKALVIADQLNIQEFKKWVEKELEGYRFAKSIDIPAYRILDNKRSVYRIWQPIEEIIVQLKNPIDKLPLIDITSNLIVEERIEIAFIHQIDGAVRNIILKQVLQLIKDGNLGEGIISLAGDKSKTQYYYIFNYMKQPKVELEVKGNIGSVQFGDHNTANVNQTVNPNNTEILQVIAELRRQVSTLAVDKQSIANAAIDDIETAITNPTQVEKAKSSLWTLWGISQGIATFANAATAVAERFGVHFHS